MPASESTSITSSKLLSSNASLAISRYFSSTPSSSGSSGSSVLTDFFLIGTTFSSLTGSESLESSTSTPKILAVISSLVPVHLTPNSLPNFFKSLYFIASSSSLEGLPSVFSTTSVESFATSSVALSF